MCGWITVYPGSRTVSVCVLSHFKIRCAEQKVTIELHNRAQYWSTLCFRCSYGSKLMAFYLRPLYVSKNKPPKIRLALITFLSHSNNLAKRRDKGKNGENEMLQQRILGYYD